MENFIARTFILAVCGAIFGGILAAAIFVWNFVFGDHIHAPFMALWMAGAVAWYYVSNSEFKS